MTGRFTQLAQRAVLSTSGRLTITRAR